MNKQLTHYWEQMFPVQWLLQQSCDASQAQPVSLRSLQSGLGAAARGQMLLSIA
jgi:hypothetical protein